MKRGWAISAGSAPAFAHGLPFCNLKSLLAESNTSFHIFLLLKKYEVACSNKFSLAFYSTYLIVEVDV